ncbi:MAG: acetyl/propionyl/methylcrotonyl-CoA carboxylase subunit alpha [Paludisphaera borealis]|uniref:acetyl/propionyl/methylcrotonyl-CoA carboxylase subunit alpha n=1 Tax=Paludisphaera borealis TaxID=1387353 RepID=UPI0028515F9C|nr:acetyl/propionyl/methylcrotonyl-CoA carboxylase subunit alpha [Paludisphaera borealis]MDR3617979.1 acetyl/propionyl/methylcrotonyl-CoA carboxylase subunit alpha [Paludisphaera borealis]
MFQKILIANRGEIACRIIRTARAMGVKTVAVYSQADKDALHVDLADEAVAIGPAPARQSYLNIDAVITACKQTGAEAVHPGYGFLSENEAFARRLAAEGIVFIGPQPDAIAAMGDKIASKRLAREAGVNVIPGHDEPIGSARQAVEIAREVGYPVMIKASAGGGGKGLRVAHNDAEAAEGFDSCRAEAASAFGDDRVFLEKYIASPRHIEIQVLGDAHGQIVSLWERECSLQRRHQKVVEESPSPFLDEATRQAMSEQAVALARAVAYQSAGTVEFVVGADRSFYFLEMNTRLQVEHPVTEMITGLDLVEQMIRVAAGEKLGFTQEQVRRDGWAIECRINAENPFRNFLPSTGRLVRYRPPDAELGAVRIDTGVVEGDEISIHYDSMIAKLITHGRTRNEAIGRMHEALDAFVIRGVASNLAFQAALTRNPRFVAGEIDTGLIAEDYPDGFRPSSLIHDDPLLLAAVAAYARRRYIERASAVSGQLEGHSRKVDDDWVVLTDDARYELAVVLEAGGCTIVHGGARHQLRTDWKLGDLLLRGVWNGREVCVQVERIGLKYRVLHRGTQFDAFVMTPRAAELLALMPNKPAPDLSKFLLSPMPGLLAELSVQVGQEVHAGETLAVIEAMKMRNVLKADHDRIVAELLAEPGASLAVDQPILRFE